MSDQVGNPEDRFSHNEAQIISDNCGYIFSYFKCLTLGFLAFIKFKYFKVFPSFVYNAYQ